MIVYKLTDADGTTYGGTRWGEGVKHTVIGTGPLCSAGWLHYYDSPELSVLLNPIHANFASPRLWEARRGRKFVSDGLKCGARMLTTLKEVPLPEVTAEIQVRFAIFCALAVYDDPQFSHWAKSWLTGVDRSNSAEWAAVMAAEAVRAAAWAAVRARAAEWAAVRAAEAVRAAVRAEEAMAEETVRAAVRAAVRAEERQSLDLATIARNAFDLAYLPEAMR